MTRGFYRSGTFFATACIMAMVAFASPSEGNTRTGGVDCPVFPKVNFWGDLTHQTARIYVKETHGGDWVPFLNQLQRQYETLANIQDHGKGAIIERNGRKIRLSGKQLAKYIKVSGQRLSVVACLSEREEAKGLENFSTAAGTSENDEPSSSPSPAKHSAGGGLDKNHIALPEDLLAKLRKAAVRESLREARKVSVNEVVVDILRKQMKKRSR